MNVILFLIIIFLLIVLVPLLTVSMWIVSKIYAFRRWISGGSKTNNSNNSRYTNQSSYSNQSNYSSSSSPNKIIPKDEGEYVDFEEVTP